MNPSDIAECRAIGRRRAPKKQYIGFRRDKMVVKAIRGSKLDVDGGTESLPMKMTGVPMTTACSGVKVGDVVIVDTFMHQPVAIGVLAR